MNTILKALETAHSLCNKYLPSFVTGIYPKGDARRYAPSTKIENIYSAIWNPMRKLQIKAWRNG